MENSIQRMPLPSPRKRTGELGGGVPSWESSISLPSQLESRLNASLGGGQGLPNQVRSQMEGAFGRSFSDVHIHTDSVAAEMSSSIGARAFTYGNDIFFNRGQFSPHSSDGQHLIAHELTHVTQGSGRIGREPNYYTTRPGTSYGYAPSYYYQKPNSPVAPKPRANASGMGRDIKVESGKEEDDVRQALLGNPLLPGFESSDRIIFSNDSENIKRYKATGLEIIDNIVLPACDALIDYARWYNDNNSPSSLALQIGGQEEYRKSFVKQLVQQVYNTLSQVSVAMDMFPKPYDGDMKATPWMTCRNHFNRAVKNLATVAHNPAIAVLMYEGTYYPNEYDSVTTKASTELAENADATKLNYYGAVCNNAAYGSVLAASVDYQFWEDVQEGDRLRVLSLAESGKSRTKWGNYNLLGTGVGSDALDHAKQGDVVIFWKYSKLDNNKINKNGGKDTLKMVNDRKTAMDNAKKAKDSADNAVQKAQEAVSKAKGDKLESAQKDLEGKMKVFESKTEAYNMACKNYYNSHANLVIEADSDAHHTEVIVGIRKNPETSQMEYLLSGAHGSNFVNGFTRDRGKLDWKTAEGIRDGRILRCIPMNNESNLITVDIASIMQEQNYKMGKKEHDDAAFKAYINASDNQEIKNINTLDGLRKYHKTKFKELYPKDRKTVNKLLAEEMDKVNAVVNQKRKELKGSYLKGSYMAKKGEVNVYENRNTSSSVPIHWIEKKSMDKVDDTSQTAQEQ